MVRLFGARDSAKVHRSFAFNALNLPRRCEGPHRWGRFTRHPVLVSDWVVAEAYHALQHHYGNSKKDALEALRAFLAAPGVENSGGAAEILARPHLESARPGFIDRIIHRDYQRSHAEAMVTFEKAAAKLPGVQVLTA